MRLDHHRSLSPNLYIIAALGMASQTQTKSDKKSNGVTTGRFKSRELLLHHLWSRWFKDTVTIEELAWEAGIYPATCRKIIEGKIGLEDYLAQTQLPKAPQ